MSAIHLIIFQLLVSLVHGKNLAIVDNKYDDETISTDPVSDPVSGIFRCDETGRNDDDTRIFLKGCDSSSKLIKSNENNNLFISDEAPRYHIRVANECSSPINVVVFSHPAEINGKPGDVTYSLNTKVVQGHEEDLFIIINSPLAAAAKFDTSVENASTNSVFQEIQLKTKGKDDGQRTQLTLDSDQNHLLSNPAPWPAKKSWKCALAQMLSSEKDGTFQIQTPLLPKKDSPEIDLGSGFIIDGHLQLATSSKAESASVMNIEPILKFHVAIGSTEPGTPIDNIAELHKVTCDASGSTTECTVSYTLGRQLMISDDNKHPHH